MNILDLKNPIWFMRQAGRHLPEYRAIRTRKNSFMDFCFDVDSVVEATLQPIHRYDLDCSIIFSDILVLPFVLGQKIKFVKNHGPKLENLSLDELLSLQENIVNKRKLDKTYVAIKKVREKLNKNKSLIGFCGAPWTVLCYMIDGNSKTNFSNAKNHLVHNKKEILALLDKIVDLSLRHLEKQYKSGCDTLMIFESWASTVSSHNQDDILYNPVQKIISGLKAKNISAPVIVFPRGIKNNVINYINNVSADILGIDFETDINFVIKNLKKEIVLQGNINPVSLKEGGNKLKDEVSLLIKAVSGRKHIFNLGHGILPETPPENVKEIVNFIRMKV